jgi:hypothetical protein
VIRKDTHISAAVDDWRSSNNLDRPRRGVVGGGAARRADGSLVLGSGAAGGSSAMPVRQRSSYSYHQSRPRSRRSLELLPAAPWRRERTRTYAGERGPPLAPEMSRPRSFSRLRGGRRESAWFGFNVSESSSDWTDDDEDEGVTEL